MPIAPRLSCLCLLAVPSLALAAMLPAPAAGQTRGWMTETTPLRIDPRDNARTVGRVGRCEAVEVVPGGPLSFRWVRVRAARNHGYVPAHLFSRDRPQDCGPAIARPEGRVPAPQAEVVIPRGSIDRSAITTLAPRPADPAPPRTPEEERADEGPVWGP
ncbi:MAG: hypothetical protein JJU19_11395 [Pararhodobacter sp.]|nr:hypothetical protein [Pararhodobacter sp.]